MRRQPGWMGRAAASAALALVMLACSAPVNTARMEALMIKSGFQVKRADTPERLAHLKTLTPRKIVKHERDGRAYYVFADVEGCECVYVGDEAAYQRYRKLAQESQEAAVQRLADAPTGDAMRWGVWDPFFW